MPKRSLIIMLSIIVAVIGLILLALPRSARDGVLGRVSHKQGDRLDSLNGVVVFCNGGFSGNAGRSIVDGYNVGIKYQCVEFVKRYYFERFGHRMPNSYGNACDLFDTSIADGTLNTARGLIQFTNGSVSAPRPDDLVVFGGTHANRFGHVAIISRVEDGEVEVVQQNTGRTRDTYDLELVNGKWRIGSERVMGWLRRR